MAAIKSLEMAGALGRASLSGLRQQEIPARPYAVLTLDEAHRLAGERIHVHLTPDRLSWTPEEQTPVDNGYMVRGFFAPEARAFMLSDMRI